MKTKQVRVAMAACMALALAQGASASLLVGFYSFNGIKPVLPTDEVADYSQPNISGWITSPLQASQGSGGSYDGTYGNIIPTNQSPAVLVPPGDGSGTIRSTTAFESTLTMWIQNNSGLAVPLDYLVFDAAEVPHSDVLVHQKMSLTMVSGLSETKLLLKSGSGLTAYDMPVEEYTSGNDFQDYFADLRGVFLDPGQTLEFRFTAVQEVYAPGEEPYYVVDTLWVDNIAISAIPEPASALSLGLVLATGLMVRSRRKPVA